MFSLINNHLPLALRSPRVLIAAGVGLAAAAGVAGYVLTRHKPTAEEIERERRDLLALTGRITDGTILDTILDHAKDRTSEAGAVVTSAVVKLDSDSADAAEAETAEAGVDEPPMFSQHESALPSPDIIIYNYRIAGVSYECAQDVSMLAERVHGIRTDLPIQVRYAPHNPGNSIVVAETWSGLRLISANPRRSDSRHTT